MNISIVGSRGIPANYSGVEKAVEETAKLLAERGHKITVYCRPAKNKGKQISYNKNIKLIILPTINDKYLGTIIHVFLATLHVLFSKVDIVHFQALGPAFFSFLPRIFGKKTVVTVQGLDWKRKKWGSCARKLLKLCEYSSIYFPNKTIVVSKQLKKYLEEKFKKKVYFIPNGVEVYKGSILPESANEYQSLGLAENKYILFVGRLVPEKGLHCLIKAFSKLKTDMKLVIAGEPSFTDEYVNSLKKISNVNIIYMGFVNGRLLEILYKGAYFFVLPSEVEGISLALLEAMGYKKCVLTSDIPECLEVIENAGFSFKLNNAENLKTKLQMLIANPKLVEEAGLAARDIVIKKYDWGIITDEVEKLYFSLAVQS